MCHKLYSDQDSGIGLQDQECWKDPMKGSVLHSLRKGLNAPKSQRHIIMSSTKSLSDGAAMCCDIGYIKNHLDHICHATAENILFTAHSTVCIFVFWFPTKFAYH